ncbi:MAG: hypothetical protein ABUL60_05085 [Myxococcales bacterium]
MEDQITIVIEAMSHENDRRDRRPLRVGWHESQDFFSRPLAPATPYRPAEAPETPRETDEA